MEMHEVQAMVKAYNAGKRAAEEMLQVGSVFLGSFNVADTLYKRDETEWRFAHLGALSHIDCYFIHVDGEKITKLSRKASAG